jgi:hypothetical protein
MHPINECPVVQSAAVKASRQMLGKWPADSSMSIFPFAPTGITCHHFLKRKTLNGRTHARAEANSELSLLCCCLGLKNGSHNQKVHKPREPSFILAPFLQQNLGFSR